MQSSYILQQSCTTLLNFLWWGAAPTSGFVRYIRYVLYVEKKIMGGCGIWLSNVIDEEVIEVDKLDNDNTSAAEGK